MVDTLELSLDSGIVYVYLFKGCELLIERSFVLGDKGVGGDMEPIALFDTFVLATDDVDVFKTMRELLKWDKGTELDDDEFFTVFTLVSDKANNFLTASGECVP